ncbi:MAG TPA: hypothetical protein PLY73_09630, partial [Candidatus Ozemobacteraceae bacterium]|nr:hypothetical protein [Candidatus Ozemobacteraceae bacterium]
SDHFTEQYDPVLITAVADFIAGTSRSPFASARRVLGFALLAVIAFLGGTRAAGRSAAFRAFFVGAALALWQFGSRLEWPRGPAVLALLGMLAGPLPGGPSLRFVTVFWSLMAINVSAASAWFRDNISSDIIWLPLMMFWYLSAWVVKLTLFVVSLVRRADPFALEAMPSPLLVVAMLALAVPNLPGLLGRTFQSSAANSHDTRQRTLALLLVSIMAALWVVRFFQGFLRLEILESMAGTYLRTLLLPALWLLWKSISALRASAE